MEIKNERGSKSISSCQETREIQNLITNNNNIIINNNNNNKYINFDYNLIANIYLYKNYFISFIKTINNYYNLNNILLLINNKNIELSETLIFYFIFEIIRLIKYLYKLNIIHTNQKFFIERFYK